MAGGFPRVHYLTDNPWPLGIVLAVLAAGTLIHALREGLPSRLRIAAALAIASGAVFVIEAFVTTPSEHAARVTRAFIDAAEAGDVTTAVGLLADDASMSFGDPRAPGIGHDALLGIIDQLAGRYRVATNRITRFEPGEIGPDEGEVQFGCLTELERGADFGPTPSAWIVRVHRDDDEVWRIRRLTMESVAGRRGESGMVE